MEGNVLVCVANVAHAEKLIEKGHKLAKMMGSKCFVLTAEKESYNVLDYNLVYRKVLISKICKERDIPFVYLDNEKRKFEKVVEEEVEINNISHVLIGQPMKQGWSFFGEGSILNDLFITLGEVDIHIVKVIEKQIDFNDHFNRGVHVTAYEVDGEMRFTIPEGESGTRMDGIYFQATRSQFENGVFKINDEDGEVLYRVVEGKIIETITEESLEQMISF